MGGIVFISSPEEISGLKSCSPGPTELGISTYRRRSGDQVYYAISALKEVTNINQGLPQRYRSCLLPSKFYGTIIPFFAQSPMLVGKSHASCAQRLEN